MRQVILFVCVAIGFFMPIVVVDAAVIQAVSCSKADIQAAHDAALPGDTVAIPAGECTWGPGDHMTITKQVSIIGAGITSGQNLTKIIHTVLDDDSSASPATFTISVTSDVPVRISGIYFDKGSNIRGPSYPNLYREAIYIKGSSSNAFALTHIRIDHNYFNRGVDTVFSSGYVYGVIDSNTFLNPDTGIFIRGDDSYAWGRSIAAGTPDALFVEGNTFILDGNFGTGASDEMIYPQQGARPVVRYNTYNATAYVRTDTPMLCTSHPNWGGSAPYYQDYRGQPIYEIYNNAVSLVSSYNSMMGGNLRGGSLLIHDNKVTKSNPGSAEVIAGFTEEEGWKIGGPWCYPYWTANTNYSLGDKRQPQRYNGYYYQVSADNGVSGSTEPAWPTTLNALVTDGGLVWTNMGAAPCPKITTWPANDQVTNSFVWNNSINVVSNNAVSLPATTSNGEGYDDVIIQLGRDYFLHAPEPAGGRTYYVSNSECTGQANPAACCTGNRTGVCSQGHYDALVYVSSGANAYYPYTPYICPHPLTGFTGTCDSRMAGTVGYNIVAVILYGDVSENGSVTAYDASLAAQYAVGLITLTQAQIPKADVSGNGTVTSYDASLIAQYAVGLITKFPVEGG